MITPIPVPVPVPTQATTPSNISNAIKNAVVVQKAGSAPIIPKINTSTGLPTGVGGGIANTGYNAATNTTKTTSAGNESVKCPNNKIYSVSSADIKSSGGTTSWCQRNGHYAGSANFVGFDGKILRPSHKVDFF
jgi:hypothetical protein